jgi:glycosyltransferase involved in cell wall biosynthesis
VSSEVAGLTLGIESPLPAPLVAGRGNAFLVHGWCFHDSREVRSLDLVLGGERFPALAHSVSRPDLAERGERAAGGGGGFWGIAEVGRHRAPARHELVIEAQLVGGGTAVASAGEIEVLPAIPVDWSAYTDPPSDLGWPLVAICLPTYEPKMDLFRAQIDSIRRQTHGAWYCLVVDDASSPERAAEIQAEIEGDERFLFIGHENRLGFYRNIERALSYANPVAAVVALCDQDDSWHADKLETLLLGLGDADLVYCDMRVVDEGGEVIAPNYWDAVGRRNEYRDLATLMISNTVTGAASLFRTPLLSYLLPFPEAPGPAFHDHWLALVSLAIGGIAYVDRPLQDYVQHGANVTSNVELGWRESPASVYANDVLHRTILARVIARRCAGEMTAEKERTVNRFARGDGRLAERIAFSRMGRSAERRESTLGLEEKMLEGLRWANSGEGGGPLPVVDHYGQPARMAP